MRKETLFARHGFMESDLEVNVIGGRSKVGTFLKQALNYVGQTGDPIPEAKWMEALLHASTQVERVGREMSVDPREQELPLAELDPYIRGIVRWLNELGLHTSFCCDGHNKRPAHVSFIRLLKKEEIRLLKACATKDVRIKIEGKKATFLYRAGEVQKLLDVSEHFFALVKDPANIIHLEADGFKSKVMDLLSISGASGNERKIRNHLRQQLNKITDYTYMDRAGNLLAYLNCGEGPTVLLSAHMDTVEEFSEDRYIIEEGTVLSSSDGVLGADDRAGIAVVLEVLSRISKTNFNGTLKVAFTVKEEIGCVGAREIDQEFISDIDAAIVVDRRGTRDIVTSNYSTSFCPDEYGELFEKAGQSLGMEDWKVTVGGSSDARVFAEYSIPSVNLSAGYLHEHTDFETLDYKAAYETMILVEGVLHQQLIGVRGDVQTGEEV
ncbi:peptidase M42 family protein [Alkalihalophilus pseudofirmus OF4]|uniref:Peptidase M42 family protein n=1 Tax=Alkalihalophilus pseudofirmus (strain ATCC BAA-2126 / JCM 17055 / OF4) TaxID=398511 RepID=D3FQW4_ALKPO|nr:M20/M25/M40 family metallo-hydrolase [Alkalihalophilus pseudofirmus]ADC51484.1 peptidase M42 family protein [Alkalihalophilus pseudofirmus OF4]